MNILLKFYCSPLIHVARIIKPKQMLISTFPYKNLVITIDKKL